MENTFFLLNDKVSEFPSPNLQCLYSKGRCAAALHQTPCGWETPGRAASWLVKTQIDKAKQSETPFFWGDSKQYVYCFFPMRRLVKRDFHGFSDVDFLKKSLWIAGTSATSAVFVRTYQRAFARKSPKTSQNHQTLSLCVVICVDRKTLFLRVFLVL